MGFFEGAGNLLDLPASSLRDLIGGVRKGEWENPFDQYLDPFGTEDRLNITEATGLEGLPGWLADLILDPVNLIGGAGIAKSLPKLLKARRAAKATQAMKRTRAMRQARGKAGGIKSGLTRRKRPIAREIGLPPESADLVTEELAQSIGRTLKGPPGPGIFSRLRSGASARGRGLKGRARHLGRQFRRLPRYSQATIGAKGLTGALGGGFSPKGLLDEEVGVAPLLGGDTEVGSLPEDIEERGLRLFRALPPDIQAAIIENLKRTSGGIDPSELEFGGPTVGRQPTFPSLPQINFPGY